jgi:Ca2+/Na+ antiporter
MLTQDQNTIIYLMFLNGILFLGLNFIAYSLVFPGPKGSKRLGYILIVSAILAFSTQLQYRALLLFDFQPGQVQKILLFGMISPVFLISVVYYRIKKNYQQKMRHSLTTPHKEQNETD